MDDIHPEFALLDEFLLPYAGKAAPLPRA